MGKLYFLLLLMVLVNLSWAHAPTTNSPSEDTTVEVVANKPEHEAPVHDSAVEDTEAGSGDDAGDQIVAVKPEEIFTCSAAGLYAHASNCQLYHECSSTGSTDGSLQLVTKSCSERESFSAELKRCSREISSCKPNVQCMSKGVIADPANNASYYLCQPKFGDSNFYIFHVYCGKREVFFQFLGICLSSLEDFLINGLTGQFETPDIVAVRKEIQVLKEEYKEQLKKVKQEKKAHEKLLKKTEKEAERAEKLEIKTEMHEHNLEVAAYECESEGNFPSQVADNLYIACIYRKNKITAIPLECRSDYKFVAQTGTCVKSNSSE